MKCAAAGAAPANLPEGARRGSGLGVAWGGVAGGPGIRSGVARDATRVASSSSGSSTGRSIVFVTCAGSTASSSSATITSTAMNETPAMIRASTSAAWRLLGAAPLEEAHRDERDDAGEQRGAEREPEQLHGLHQVAAGGLVVAHAGLLLGRRARRRPRSTSRSPGDGPRSERPRARRAAADRLARREPGDGEVDGDDRGVAAEDADADGDAGEGERLARVFDRVLQRVLRRHEQQRDAEHDA